MSVQGPNRKGPQGNPDLDAPGCSHFQRDDAPWAAQHKKLAVYPLVSCKGTVGRWVCAGGRTWELMVLCYPVGTGTGGH